MGNTVHLIDNKWLPCPDRPHQRAFLKKTGRLALYDNRFVVPPFDLLEIRTLHLGVGQPVVIDFLLKFRHALCLRDDANLRAAVYVVLGRFL